jgi:hypothetical protein
MAQRGAFRRMSRNMFLIVSEILNRATQFSAFLGQILIFAAGKSGQ